MNRKYMHDFHPENDIDRQKHEIIEKGFTVVNDVFDESSMESILTLINKADSSRQTFRKSNNLFAIRQFLQEVPEAIPFIFRETFCSLLEQLFGNGFFVVKSIYFDKPPGSNWFVSYHQDLTISVKERINVEGFKNWSVKENQFAVQPPLKILQQNFTVRIHLDDATVSNGALRVIPESHLEGIRSAGVIDKDSEVICEVPKGGIMIMRPLLLHASGKSTNNNKRRVLHIEFSNVALPLPLQWSEKYDLPSSTHP